MTAARAATSQRIIGTTLPRMSALDLAGWKIMGLRNRIDDRLWERRLNIQTRGQQLIHVADAHFYDTFAYCSILRVLDALSWKPDDVFVDIGCGKGRVVCCAARKSISKAMGVDLDQTLCDSARQNAAGMRQRHAPIEIVHASATEVDYSPCTKFFFFNPFGAATMKQVLAAIADSLHKRPRSIELAYVNPVHDELIADVPSMHRYQTWHWKAWSSLKHDVTFWRNSDSPSSAG